jgi:hypothetical protein
MPLSLVESTYQAIQSTTPSLPSLYDTSPYPFHMIFPTDEMIMKFMSMGITPWDDGHHHSIIFLEPETIESYQWISNLSTVVVISLFLNQHTMFCMKGTWVIFHLPFLLIYQSNPESCKMLISVPHVLLMRFTLINPFSNNFVTFFPGVMKKCLVLILILLCMRLRFTQMLNPFGRDFAQYIHIKILLLSLKLKNILNLALSILWL